MMRLVVPCNLCVCGSVWMDVGASQKEKGQGVHNSVLVMFWTTLCMPPPVVDTWQHSNPVKVPHWCRDSHLQAQKEWIQILLHHICPLLLTHS